MLFRFLNAVTPVPLKDRSNSFVKRKYLCQNNNARIVATVSNSQ